MTDHHIAAAEAIILAAEEGAYDDRLGISSATRELLTKAADGSHEGGGDPLTLADLAELRRINRDDLIVAAHQDGRINLNPNGDTK